MGGSCFFFLFFAFMFLFSSNYGEKNIPVIY